MLFAKKVSFFLLNLGLLCATGPALRASENEVNLTEAIRGGVGSLRFGGYVQDVGLIRQGEKLEFRFSFVEEKAAAVRILGIHQECGCLSQSLRPGQEIGKSSQGELLVKVDTTHFTGAFDKELVILTNEDRDRPHIFRMRANIERQVTVVPPLVELEVGNKSGENQVVRVKVRSASKQTLHIEKVQYNEDTLEVDVYQVQEAWELAVRWKGSEDNTPINETIELLMDGPVKSLKIPVVGIQGRAPRISLSAPH